MVRLLHNLTRKTVALLTSVLLVGFWVPGLLGTPAYANTSGNATYGNFEIDGNLYDGTANTGTATSHASGAADDWVNLLNGPTLSDPVGNTDTTTFSGSKECDVDGNCQVGDWAKGTGLASPKDDLSKVFTASRLVPDANGDLWGYFGFERAANNGTTFFDFELNQKGNHTNGNQVSVPTRTAGDVLIIAQQQGNNDFSISGTIQRWTTSNAQCDTGLIATGSAGGCWTKPTTLGTNAFFGLANDSTISDLPSSDGTRSSNLFGEFAVDVTAAGAVVDCPSTGFVALNVRTRSSISDTAETKDYATGPINVPSACGELVIQKKDADTGALVGGATFTITPSPATGTGAAVITDNVAPTALLPGDSDPTAGIIDIAPAKPGITYSVQETGPPPGYLPPSPDTQTVTVSKFQTGVNAATLTFTDTKIAPALHLDKAASPATYSQVGDTVTYTYTLKNTGNVPLTPPYAVSDNKTTVTCPTTPLTLAVNGTVTCTATYTIKQADLDAGSVTNLATATAKYLTTTVTSNQATATVTADQHPKLTLAKTAETASFSAAGQTLSYSYLLTNLGNVTLYAPYTVSDDKTSVSCPSSPASLAPGDTVTCTSSYTTTQADVDAGQVVNTAHATAHEGSSTGQTVTSNEDSATVPAVQTTALGLQKDVTETSYDAAGDVLHYTYTLTNTGNVTLHEPYAVSDDKTTVSCPTSPATLAPNDTVQCTASYTVKQSDVDAGQVLNTATATAHTLTATGALVTSNEAQALVPAIRTPKLHLDKVAAEANYDAVGDVLHYTYTLTNTGNVTLSTPYAVTDDKTTVTCDQTPSTLAPNGTVQCTATYTIKQADLDAGSVTNHATATAQFDGNTVSSNEAHVTVPAVQHPTLSLTKTPDPTTYDHVGQVIDYTYVLKNTGNVTLSAPFAVNDDKNTVSCPSVLTTLAPGATVSCSGSYTITLADLNAGSVTNHATATAMFDGDTVTSNQAQATVNAVQAPSLDLSKTPSPTTYDHVGQVITYTYVLTNDGNVSLSAPYAVADDKIATVTCPSTPSTLVPGATVTCSGTYTITQADLDASSVTNHATASAFFGSVKETSPQRQATVTAVQNPHLTLTKTPSPTTYDHVGQVISYTYTATNDGNVTLSAPYAVSDDKTTVDCPSTPSALAPGAHVTCTATYLITQADLDAGSVTNHATATAFFDETKVTSNQAQATVTADQGPSLTLAKAASPTTYDAPGQSIGYTYTLTNSGNVTLSAPYAVSDDKIASVDCPSTPSTLAPGASVQCTTTYSTTQADVDNGSVTNHATATAQFGDATVTSNQAQATVTAVQNPSLTLTKTPAEVSFDAPGLTLHYTYTLINSGNVTLSAPYAVSDDKIASVDCPTTPATLAPGGTVQCTATYTTTQADLDNGLVLNHATATAFFGSVKEVSNEAQATVPAVQAPALHLVKNAAEASYSAVGDVLHYTYTLTNSGNVTLSTPYAVTDDKTTVTCPSAPTTLAPGVSVDCTATYTVTQADLDAGSVTNHATATAVFGGQSVTSNEDEATVPAIQSPAVSLVKSVDKKTASYGDTLTYHFKVTNVGNTDLADVVVSDVIPAKTAYVSGSASPNATFNASTKTVSWNVGSLAAGASNSTLTFAVTIITPSFDPSKGLPPETIDNVGSVSATGIPSAPSNHVKTPVTSVLGVKIVKKPTLAFTGFPTQPLVAVALFMLGAGIILTSVRRRRES